MRSRRTAEDRQYRMDRWTNGQTVQPRTLLSFSSCYMCIDILIAIEREREGEKVIDTESLYGSIQHIATAQILSLYFFLLPARRRRPEDSVRRRRWSWEFSFFFFITTLVIANTKSHNIQTHSSYEGIEEHERDPVCFGFFNTLSVGMSRRWTLHIERARG